MMNKTRQKHYDRVMSRVYNDSRSSLRSNSVVMRHGVPSSVHLGAKASTSNVSSSVISELPTVLNDYVPEVYVNKPATAVKKSRVVKPRRTLRSMDTSKSPPLMVNKGTKGPKHPAKRLLKAQGSTPAVIRDDEWSESHVRQCYSSRSHTKLKELKDEIKAYHETEKLMILKSRLYKKCGIVFDDDCEVIGQDKEVQAEVEIEKEPETQRYVLEMCFFFINALMLNYNHSN